MPDLKDVLAAIPASVRADPRSLADVPTPVPTTGAFFAERMTVRLAPVAPVNDPTTPWRPNAKVIHRAHPQVVVRKGNHSVEGVPLQPLRGWSPVEVLHFPWRSSIHATQKANHFSPETMYHVMGLAHEAQAAGDLGERYDAFVIDDHTLERGLAEGSLVEDTRVRDALRVLAGVGEVSADMSKRRFAVVSDASALTFARPTVVDDAAYAVDLAVYAEAELVRAQRRLDDLEQRVAALERGLGHRLVRTLRRVVRRGDEL